MKYSEHPIGAMESRIPQELKDAAQRASDTANLHMVASGWDNIKHQWIAFKLSDGTSDGTLYDSKQDAVRHQLNEYQCYYFSFRNFQGVLTNPREMAIVMQFAREAYDAGFRLPDPDDSTGGPDVLMTAARYDNIRARLGL